MLCPEICIFPVLHMMCSRNLYFPESGTDLPAHQQREREMFDCQRQEVRQVYRQQDKQMKSIPLKHRHIISLKRIPKTDKVNKEIACFLTLKCDSQWHMAKQDARKQCHKFSNVGS